jgi:galactonate dehydratase
MTTIAAITPLSIRASRNTVWTCIRVRAGDGLGGTGEATLNGCEHEIWAAAEQLGSGLVGGPADPRDEVLARLAAAPRSLAVAAVASAIDTALWDIEAQRRGVGLAALLGTRRRTAIALYANIDRRTRDRHPAGFAASAALAAARGYGAIKIAPFDGVEPGALGTVRGRWSIGRGIERIGAVRKAIGPARRLLVDCHGRFDEASAGATLRELEPFDVYWLENPVAEAPDNYAALRRLRSVANQRGIRIAGGALQTGVAAFRRLIAAGLHDVVMPDVKYAGGLSEIRRIADLAAAHDLPCALHNPSGPIGHATSLHVGAVLTSFLMLEQQFDESSLFHAICPGLPSPHAGSSPLPDAAGLGVALDDAAIAAVSWRPDAPANDPPPQAFFNHRGSAVG